MKNDYKNAMYLYDMEMNEVTLIKLKDGNTLSIIPEYGYHYRDAQGFMHIARRDFPHHVQLNCMLLDSQENLIDNSEIYFPREEDFFNFLKEKAVNQLTT